jgi:hypothetical protein
MKRKPKFRRGQVVAYDKHWFYKIRQVIEGGFGGWQYELSGSFYVCEARLRLLTKHEAGHK